MSDYHGILVNVSQKDSSIFRKLKTIGQKKDGNWILYKIKLHPNEVTNVSRMIQQNMKSGFYFHAYKKNKLIVVFKEKIFNVSTSKFTWSKVVEYGKSTGIPAEQLDFYPCRAEDETY